VVGLDSRVIPDLFSTTTHAVLLMITIMAKFGTIELKSAAREDWTNFVTNNGDSVSSVRCRQQRQRGVDDLLDRHHHQLNRISKHQQQQQNRGRLRHRLLGAGRWRRFPGSTVGDTASWGGDGGSDLRKSPKAVRRSIEFLGIQRRR
jgi:hypothetical protein